MAAEVGGCEFKDRLDYTKKPFVGMGGSEDELYDYPLQEQWDFNEMGLEWPRGPVL